MELLCALFVWLLLDVILQITNESYRQCRIAYLIRLSRNSRKDELDIHK